MKIKQRVFVSLVALAGCLSNPVLADLATVEKNADVDGSGSINSIDMSLLQRKITGLPMGHTAWVNAPSTGDLDCSGRVDSIDLSHMNGLIAGLNMSYAAGKCPDSVTLPPTLPATGAGDNSYLTIPAYCRLDQNNIGYGKNIYKCEDIELAAAFSYIAIVVDLSKAKVNFGRGMNVDYVGGSNERFFRKKTLISWRSYLRNRGGYPFAVLNGLFFEAGDSMVEISSPLKSDGYVINHKNHNPNHKKRTLAIDYNGKAKIYEGYKKQYLYHPDHEEVLVSYHPDAKIRPKAPIGRNYIGTIENPHNNGSSLLFLISKSSNQNDMMKRMMSWGIDKDNVVVMDGSGSSQLATKNYTVYGVPFDKRSLPNVITIENDYY